MRAPTCWAPPWAACRGLTPLRRSLPSACVAQDKAAVELALQLNGALEVHKRALRITRVLRPEKAERLKAAAAQRVGGGGGGAGKRGGRGAGGRGGRGGGGGRGRRPASFEGNRAVEGVVPSIRRAKAAGKAKRGGRGRK